MACVYALVDPREPLVFRYIGITRKHPEDRLDKHYVAVKRGGRHYVQNWLRALLRDGIEAKLVVLVECGLEEAKRIEVAAITAHRALGTPLTNLSAGGDGVHGPGCYSEAARAACVARGIRRRGKKHSAEHREKISAGLRRRYERDPEAREKQRRGTTGRVLSSSTKAKIGRGNIGKVRPPELRERIAASLRGRQQPPLQAARSAESCRRLHHDLEVQARRLAALARAASDPAYRAKQSENMRRVWAERREPKKAG